MAEERVNPYSGMSVSEIAAARKETAAKAPENRQARMDELKTQREAVALQRALARAASSPQFNFTQRPEGKIDEEKGVIRYYGWNGGKTTGKWVLREAALNETNLQKYGTRVPAMEYAVSDIKAVPKPLRDIGGNAQVPNGFTVDVNGNIITRGTINANLLSIKSDYDQKVLQDKATTREKAALERAISRAQTSPTYNFMSRPEGKVTDDRIYFYSWVGGKDTGSWYLYEINNDKAGKNLAKYGTRVPSMQYFQPTSIRDVLIPRNNIFGEPQNNPIVTK